MSDIKDKYTDINSLLTPSNNDITIASGYDAINNSIYNLLTVRKYEVPSQPGQFIDLYGYLHEIADEITFEALRIEVKDAIYKWDTRIEVIEVVIEDYSIDNFISLTVVYRLRNNKADNLQSTTVTIKE